MTPEPITVAVALIAREGRYLIRQRPALPGSPMPGYWEFPGGKCEASEAPLACAVREVREEANLSIKVLRLRRVIRHDYPHGDVLLHFFDCETSGPGDEPAPLTGFRWVAAAELPDYQFPGGNTEIVTQLAAEAVLGAWACN